MVITAVVSLGSVSNAQPKINTEAAARGKAVEKIMAQIEQVQLSPGATGRDLFERFPALGTAARDLVAKTAAESPVAALQPSGHRVDVSLPGHRLLSHLEKVCTTLDLSRAQRRSISLGGFARGRVYSAGGEAGGVPLPRVWRAVGQRGRDLAAAAARLQGLEAALTQIVSAARNQGLTGADRLATILGDANWVRQNAARLIRYGARDLRGPLYVDDGTCRVVVELPSAALFRVLDDQGHVPGLAGEVRAALAKSLKPISGTGIGVAKAPEAADAVERPRVLQAKFTALPAPGATGAAAMTGASRAARLECQKRLRDQLYRVRWDERRTVYDYLSERLAAGDTAVRDRFNHLLGLSREVQSRAAPGDQWYVEMELNLDGLEAALRG